MRRLAILLVAAIALAACGRDEPVGTATFGLEPDTLQENPGESQLMLAKARWVGERNARDYSFVTWYLCFCAGEVEVPVRVTVRRAQVVSVREVTSGRSREAASYYTIEALFDRAIEARGRDVPVRVTYTPSQGYPAWLTIGTPENDAGVTYRVQDVRLE